MMSTPRCGAKTRGGGPCRAPAVHGKVRCRMHGGAAGSGAPKGNRHALKHGAFGKEVLELVREARRLQREAREAIKKLSF